jgi:hypothetical protein
MYRTGWLDSDEDHVWELGELIPFRMLHLSMVQLSRYYLPHSLEADMFTSLLPLCGVRLPIMRAHRGFAVSVPGMLQGHSLFARFGCCHYHCHNYHDR